MRGLICISALLAAAAAGAVVDRTAVAVGTDVITETEIMEEIRVVAFLNDETLDFSPHARLRAAERLVDQYLIRREMRISMYQEPEPEAAERMLQAFRRNRFRTEAEYRAALQRYGITEEQVKRHLLWQLTALRFTDLRFRAGLPAPAEGLLERLERQNEARAGSLAPSASRSVEATPPPANKPLTVDQQLDQWLRQARERTRVVFMKEAFQ